ncbi:MAG: GNAT family N-acetyltransferase [Nocardioides sp.]
MPPDHDYYVRPMTTADVAGVERLTAEGFFDLDVRTRRAQLPPPSPRSPEKSVNWQIRVRHMLDHDGPGCFVAEDESGLIGATVALRRELMWILATYVVRPGLQGRGVGKQLLDAALTHGRGCLRGLIASSEDQAAVRHYRLAGFTLQPAMYLAGTVPRDVLPVIERVRDGSHGDIDLMNSVDRQTREAAHGVDHELMASMYRLVVVDRSTGSGYAYVEPGGGPYLLAATNRRTAAALLWETLAASSPDRTVAIGHVTAANEWAVDVGFAARMALHTSGYLATRHLKLPMPYLPSGHFL